MYKSIYVTKAYLPPRAEFDAYLDKIWESAWLTNMGKLHEELRERLRGYLGVDGIELFVNGHLALEMCLQAFDFPEGSEVITTPFSFASTTHAIVRQGLKPVFCDIRESDCTMDPEKIEELITERTVAIVPVHVYGNPCDVDEINKIAKKHGLKVIYDAAHAFGETVDGRGIGTFGDASMFSFHATKVFNTIEGGAVTFGRNSRECGDSSNLKSGINTKTATSHEGDLDFDLEEVLYKLKNFGIMGQERVEYVGGNAKMNEFQAAMGLCNLDHIEELISKRRVIDEKYRTMLSGKVQFLERKNNVKYNYAYMPVLFENQKKRDEIFDKLAKVNIHARKYFYPCINDYDCYKKDYDGGLTPIARSAASRVLTLPIYPDLEDEAVDEICRLITE